MRNLLSILFLIGAIVSSSAQVTIIVDEIPASTPPEDPIHIAGDFQGWDPASSAHQLIKDTVENYLHITLQPGLSSIEFKFARGSWAKVEASATGGFRPNRMHTVADGDTLRLQILGWEDVAALCVPPAPPGNGSTAAENVHIMNDTFYMPQFDRCRRIWVYLPPDYDENEDRYPVMYMHDGQNVFDATTSFISEWEVDETLNNLYAEGDPGIIVVGIDNGGAFRTEEYIPWDNPNLGDTRGELYADFIVNTLKPVVDATYRTLPDRENTAVMGSSFGGVISSYCGIEYQDIFSKVGAFSQSYWVSEEAYEHADSIGKQEAMKIYQLMGALEGSGAVEGMYRMENTLHDAGFGEDEVISIEKADGEHSEWFWAREFEQAYLWLFRDQTVATEEQRTPESGITLFPNPTSGHVTIQYKLQNPSDVTIQIHDLNGSLIETFRHDAQAQGIHQQSILLDQSDYAGGLYLCTVQSDEYFGVQRFILAR